MKISSKSILTPGQTTLSTSLSRRHRTSASVNGGASPRVFSTTVKKRGTFQNPEPSSPKVTCIGQVRVRTKKKNAKKLKTLSRKHSAESADDVSFRKFDHTLDGFPSKRHKHKESLNLGSKGAQNDHQDQECSQVQRKWVHFPVTVCDALRAFGSEFSCLFPCRRGEKTTVAQWLVAVQDGGKDIELVVGDEEQDDDGDSVGKRRHVFDDLQIVGDRIEGYKDAARVSVCVPPKNALLLMRWRSDAIKVEGISRSWEPNVEKTDEEDELFDNEDKIKEDLEENLQVGQKKVMILDHDQDQEIVNVQQDESNKDHEHVNVQQDEGTEDQEHDHVQQDEVGQDQEVDNVQQNEVGPDQEHENLKEYQVGQCQEEESFNLLSLFGEIVNQEDKIQEHDVEEHNNGVLERESEVKEDRESEKVLPDCLLMMMYEPKLSMEVSKETWVCQKDFIQRQSSRRKPPQPPPPITSNGGLPTVLLQPGRSSCSLPVAASMALVLEQKLANAVGYEPFVLTRCKSEPMKSAAAKLLPESCVLENRKLEGLSRGTFGVGTAGLGF
ncbi:hypothetical protein Hdeb2414_s0004g00148511 [Helianthus debilis subsp. tardiflorus]